MGSLYVLLKMFNAFPPRIINYDALKGRRKGHARLKGQGLGEMVFPDFSSNTK